MEYIVTLGLLITFVLVCMVKFRIFDWLQVHMGMGNCFFCWGWWVALAVSVIRHIILHHDAVFQLNLIIHYILIPAACAAVIVSFLTRVIVINESN